MRRIFKRLLSATTLCLLLFSASLSAGSDYTFIDISNPFLRKIPLAVPLFKNTSGSETAEKLATTSADMIDERMRPVLG